MSESPALLVPEPPTPLGSAAAANTTRHPTMGHVQGMFDAAATRVLHAAREAMVIVDDEQRIVMMNPAAQRMFGCSAADALGSQLVRFIPERLRKAHVQAVRRFDTSGEVERPMGQRDTIVALRANGDEFPAEATISRLDVIGEFGPRRYFTALLRDLSKEQSLKAAVDGLQGQMRKLFDLAPIAIWITDGEQIVFANRACQALFGAGDGDALVGRSIYSLLRPESHAPVRQKVAQAQECDVPVTVVSQQIARLDGKVREVEIAVVALPDHGRTAVQMVLSDITEQQRERQEMARSRRELRRLSASLVEAREEERRRIARELHDELGQRLTALKMDLSSLDPSPAKGKQRKQIAAMLEMIDDTVATVRRISTDLRPAMLDDLGLNAAIEWLATGWARRMGVEMQLQLGDEDPPVGDATVIAIYRMVQEALTNIARHARASRVRIELRHDGGEFVLIVQDNGVGFAEPLNYPEGSHGLMGMRERAYMLGGRLEVGNLPGGGGRISVKLPLAPGPFRPE